MTVSSRWQFRVLLVHERWAARCRPAQTIEQQPSVVPNLDSDPNQAPAYPQVGISIGYSAISNSLNGTVDPLGQILFPSTARNRWIALEVIVNSSKESIHPRLRMDGFSPNME